MIRDYKPEDFQEMVDINIDFQNYIASVDINNYYVQYKNREGAEKYTLQLIKDATEKEGLFKVYEKEGQIIGFIQGIIDRNETDILHTAIHIEGAFGWVGEFYVKPEYRGQGIGRELMQFAKQYFQEKGCINIRLFVLAHNTESIKAYRSLGFQDRNLELFLPI